MAVIGPDIEARVGPHAAIFVGDDQSIVRVDRAMFAHETLLRRDDAVFEAAERRRSIADVVWPRSASAGITCKGFTSDIRPLFRPRLDNGKSSSVRVA
jgi:hypothetical protein